MGTHSTRLIIPFQPQCANTRMRNQVGQLVIFLLYGNIKQGDHLQWIKGNPSVTTTPGFSVATLGE